MYFRPIADTLRLMIMIMIMIMIIAVVVVVVLAIAEVRYTALDESLSIFVVSKM